MANLSPKAAALSAERDATATIVPPSVWAIASANPVAIAPGPTTPQPITYEPACAPSTMELMIGSSDNAIIRAGGNTARLTEGGAGAPLAPVPPRRNHDR